MVEVTALVVCSWLWSQPNGRTSYQAEHVNIWADSVSRHLSMDHEVAIITDMADGIDPSIRIIEPPRDFEDIRLSTWDAGKGFPQCLRRLAMYRADAADWIGERFVSMDLDCVVAASLDPLFDIEDDFRIYRGTSDARPYNGSMQMMTAGARSQVYDEFTQERAEEAGRKFVGSDQAWISHVLGWGEATWGPEDGVVWWGSSRNASAPRHRLMFFPGSPKPWDMPNNEWVALHWRRTDKWDAEVRSRKMPEIKNNLNSPQTIMTSSGPILLGPNESTIVDGFAPGYDGLYRNTTFLSVTDTPREREAPPKAVRVKGEVEVKVEAPAPVEPEPVKPHPLDLDNKDGPGGSLKAEDRGLDGLREQATALGVQVDRRWGEKRLKAEIEKADKGEAI